MPDHSKSKTQLITELEKLRKHVYRLEQSGINNKSVEAALCIGDEWQNDVLNNTSAVIYVKDVDGHYMFINRIYKELFHISSEEINGKTDYDIFPEKLAEVFQSNDLKVIELQKSVEFEEVVAQDDGEHIYISLKFPLKQKSGEIYAVCGISTDITNHIKAERKVREQLIYSEAFNTISQTIVLHDKPDTILETTTAILGETLKTDRALIYNIDFIKGKVIGLSEWLNKSEGDINSTLNTYDISSFNDGITWLKNNQTFLESHSDQMAPVLSQDGSGDKLHNQMQIISGLWVPFNFRENGFHLLVFNQVKYHRDWRKSEIEFLDLVTSQICIILQKITFLDELKKSKSDLEKSENNFATITTQSSDGIAVSDEEGNYLFVNGAFCKMVGYSEEELLQMSVFDLKAKSQDTSTFIKSKTTNEGLPIQVLLRKKDGTEFYSEIVGKMIEYNGKKSVLGTVRDITKRRQSIETLVKCENWFRSMIEFLSDGIIISDQTGRITLWNKGAQNIFGYKKDEMLGREVTNILLDSHHQSYEKCVKLVVKTDTGKRFGKMLEIEGIRKDGSVFPLEILLTTQQTIEGRNFSTIIRDITEHKKDGHLDNL
jgi:PAS domain S-box-containing protein